MAWTVVLDWMDQPALEVSEDASGGHAVADPRLSLPQVLAACAVLPDGTAITEAWMRTTGALEGVRFNSAS